jgi:hypothetical protein
LEVQSGRYKKPARLRYIRGLPQTPMETNKVQGEYIRLKMKAYPRDVLGLS